MYGKSALMRINTCSVSIVSLCTLKSAYEWLFSCDMPRSLEFRHGLLLEREDMIKLIEGDILDVNQIMRELAALTYQQGDTISE